MFAIAITLLVLEIRQPVPKGHALGHALLAQWPAFAAYVTSFLTVGIIWVNHHRMFKVIERTNHPFLMLNVLFLMAVSFIPFPTELVAEHIGDADERTVATVVYGGSMVLIAVMFNLVWGYAAAGNRLLVGGLDPVALQKGTRSYRMGPVVYGVATLIAIADPYVSLAIFAALAIYWIFPSSGPGG